MNNDPVAWTEEEIKKACRHVGLTEHMILRIKAYLPVHTHPVKELTDEEIQTCMCCLPKYNSEIVDEDLVKFAGAILKKAQEK